VAVAIIGVMVPSSFATSGEIFLEKNEFLLHGGGNMVNFSVTGEIFDYVHYPKLEIMIDDVVFKTMDVYPNKNSIFSIIGLDKNWSHGEYVVNLKYKNEILDSKSFTLIRDDVVEKEIRTDENMHETLKSFIETDVDKLVLENNSLETIWISGNLPSSQFGNKIKFSLHHPDGTIEYIGKITHGHVDYFEYPIIGIDKFWMPGEYQIIADYLDHQLSTSFTIENDFLKYPMEKEKLIGSFTLSSEISNNFTILEIIGNVESDESQIILQILQGENILFEDELPLNENSFETKTVLYDYASNTPWTPGDYRVSGFIGDESFYSDVFRLDEQNLSVFEISQMDIFLNFESEVQKMVDTDKITISYGEEKQIILSGIIENTSSTKIVEVHVVNPDGLVDISHIYASSDGSYYMPIIIDSSWISGLYTAYVTSGDFVDEPSSFEVINNVVTENEILDEEVSEIIKDDLKNYVVTLDSSKSLQSINFYLEVAPFSTNFPITVSLNDEIIHTEFIYSANEGFIDYYLLLDQRWDSGNYVVSYIENNVSIPFGTFEIINTKIVNDVLDDDISEKEQVSEYLSLDQNIFKTSSNTVDYLYFSGKLNDDSSNMVSVQLDGDLQTSVSVDSEGYYRGVVSLDDDLDVGFHELLISSGDVSESVEFLIATNNYISLDDDLEISRNSITISGGEISIFLSNIIPDFTPSDVKPVIITIEDNDNYYQRYSIIPKGYGFYSQSFVIDETIASYDVTVKYGDQIIESYDVAVILPEIEWIKPYTTLWLNGEISDNSYFKKIVLLLDEKYEVTPQVTSPEWFVDSTDRWINGLMDDDSYYDAIIFLVENRLM